MTEIRIKILLFFKYTCIFKHKTQKREIGNFVSLRIFKSNLLTNHQISRGCIDPSLVLCSNACSNSAVLSLHYYE